MQTYSVQASATTAPTSSSGFGIFDPAIFDPAVFDVFTVPTSVARYQASVAAYALTASAD